MYLINLELKLQLVVTPQLHLPSDEFTMPVRYPNHPFSSATAGRPGVDRSNLRAS